MAVGLADGRAILHNLRYDEQVMVLHNAAAAGTGAARFLQGTAAANAAAASSAAVTCLSFRTGRLCAARRIEPHMQLFCRNMLRGVACMHMSLLQGFVCGQCSAHVFYSVIFSCHPASRTAQQRQPCSCTCPHAPIHAAASLLHGLCTSPLLPPFSFQLQARVCRCLLWEAAQVLLRCGTWRVAACIMSSGMRMTGLCWGCTSLQESRC